MKKPKIPKALKGRLKEVAKKNDFASMDVFATHLLERGARHYGADDESVPLIRRLEAIVDDQGYSDVEEVIEHLLERGLNAYADDTGDRKAFEERLRGLGYID